jgi:hypothetical protein
MQNLVANNVSSNTDGTWLLYHGIKNLLRCDEAEVVSGIAAYAMSQHRALAVGSSLMERTQQTLLPSIAALLGFVTRFLEVHEDRKLSGVVWVARLSNERRAIEKTINGSPQFDWTELKLQRPLDLASLRALARISGMGPRRILDIARRLHRKHPFFKVLRSIELIAYYSRFLSMFRQARYGLAVMSSHSNPHGIAFNLAARRAGVPVVLITHGMPVRPVARLEYDLAVVHCEVARQTYIEEGCRFAQVIVHGRRRNHCHMPTSIADRAAVGIFLCKDVNEKRLRWLVEQLLGSQLVSHILIRPHPKNLWLGLDDWITLRKEPRLARSAGTEVTQDLDAVDLVLAGNSSVLVDAVTAGRPAVYMASLDYGPFDMHQFVERGLIYSKEERVGEPGLLQFDPVEVLRFYQQPQWANVLRLFANVDEDEEAVRARLISEMTNLIQESSELL